jgi:hypothetical protein
MRKTMKRHWIQLIVLALLAMSLSAQNADYRIVFKSREYKLVGHSEPEPWIMSIDGRRSRYVEGMCAAEPVRTSQLAADVRPPTNEHWNYVRSVTLSPDGRVLLVGSEAGTSDSHYQDYWIFDPASLNWRYIGGGNDARWSPDGTKILWSAPRDLAPLGNIRVWVSHLILVDVQTLERKALTSGVTYVSDFFWCSE